MYSLLRIPNGHSCWPGVARGKANVMGVWNPRDAKAVRKPAETLLFSFLLPGGQSQPLSPPPAGCSGHGNCSPGLSPALTEPPRASWQHSVLNLTFLCLSQDGGDAVKQPQFLPARNEGAGYDFLFSLRFLPSPTHHRFRIHGRLPPPRQRPQGQSLCFLHSGSKQLELSLLG